MDGKYVQIQGVPGENTQKLGIVEECMEASCV